jgi:hypothetical protein
VRKTRFGVIVLAAACSGLEPSNTDLGLHVQARVSPRAVSLADTAASVRIIVLVTNPSERDIVIITGGPPYSITTDPADSRGLTQSFRIAHADGSPNAGPSVDAWGATVDTIRARRGEYMEHVVKLGEWRQGWTVAPGDYRVRSYYNGREGSSAAFSVTP